MAGRLYVVAVGVVDEGGVVGLVVVRAQTRRAVVLCSGRERGLEEGVDGGSAARAEGDWVAPRSELDPIQKSGIPSLAPNPAAPSNSMRTE